MKYILSSLESYEFELPIKFEIIKSIHVNKKEAWVIKITPNVISQKFGLKEENIDYLLISPRHQGVALSDIHEFPCFVYIARFLSNRLPKSETIANNEIEVIAWGEIY